MRPIDADALIEKCGGWYVEEGTESGFIGTLENLLATEPTIQPVATDTNVGDTISRQAAIDALDCINGVEEVLRSLPTIQPERKKGEWLPDNNNAYEMRFVCSCCKESEVVPTIGFTKYKPLWDFCPNCGAKMINK